MKYARLVAAGLLIAVNLSCASNTAKPAAAPAPSSGAGVAAAPAARPAPPPAPAAPPAATPPAAGAAGGQRGGPPGGGGGGGFGGRGPQLTPEQNAARRDSISALRASVIADLMTRIAGSETKRAGDVFANVQLMKDTTATQLLKTMDYYGKSLSVGCQFCHVAGKWDDDTKDAKKTARVMIQLVDLINTQGLSKLGGQRPPRISCVTCHRGRTGPGTALMP